MLIIAIAIGLFYGFLLFEACGLVAGGLISPGYLAMSLDQPWTIALCLVSALLAFVLVRLLSCFTLLYGRRRFLVCILLAFVLQGALGTAVMDSAWAVGRLEVVGYVIPGLIAHEMDRQGVGRTLLALLLLTCLVWLTLWMMGRG